MNTSDSISARERRVEMTLMDAVFLGLRGNRTIRSAYLDRVVQKFDLLVAEDAFSPKLLIAGSYTTGRTQDNRYGRADLTPVATMQNEIGTRFTLSGTHQSSQEKNAGLIRNHGMSVSVVQPLLRGAGREAATAAVRSARLIAKSEHLHLKATVSQSVTQIVLAYRELLKAQEHQRIAADALSRARLLLETNLALIAAGRMAPVEIIQTEADVAMQELGVEAAANELNATRLELLQLLALDLGSPIHATELLVATRHSINLLEAQRLALQFQPAYLRTIIVNELAAIDLEVARNERLWDVSLVGAANQATQLFSPGYSGRSQSDRKWEGYIGIRMEIPIGSLNARQNELRAQVNVANQALWLKEARTVLARDISHAVRDVESRWRQYEIAKRAHELSQQKLEIEREKLRSGRSSNFQVISFEADLRRSENASLANLIGYLNAQTRIDLLLGMTLTRWNISLND